MRNNLFTIGLAFFLLVISGCSKIDFLKEHLNDYHNVLPKNDYISASADSIMMVEDEYVPFLFKKVYDPQGKLLKSVIVTFRNVALGSQVRRYDTLTVRYYNSQLHFISSSYDTVVTLNLDATGKPIDAFASATMNSDAKFRFVFSYTHRKLTEIYRPDGLSRMPYIKVDYERGWKNIHKVLYGGVFSGYNDSVTYSYNHAIKAGAQYYPDEMQGDFYYFWNFIRYMNIFEELQNENVLQYSYQTSEYPGDIKRFYSQHTFDSRKRLTSFYLSEQYTTNDELFFNATWRIAWK